MTEEEILSFIEGFKKIHPKNQKDFIGLLVRTCNDTREIYLKNSEDRALIILKSLGFKLDRKNRYVSDLSFDNIPYKLNKTISGFSLDAYIHDKRRRRCTILFAKQNDGKISKKLQRFVKQVNTASLLES
jgi:hypothetical protein